MGWITSGMRLPNVAGGAAGSSGGLGARIASRQAHKRNDGSGSGARSATLAHVEPGCAVGRAALATSGLVAGGQHQQQHNGDFVRGAVQVLNPLTSTDYFEGNYALLHSLLLDNPAPASQPSSSGNRKIAQRAVASHAGPTVLNGAAVHAELEKLVEDVAVALPPRGVVDASQLDNRRLDKLVAALGRNKVTWRRALVLYDWLKEVGHAMDDRLCTTLIRVCAEHGQAASALGVYEWMQAPARAGGAALKATVYTYTAAMRAALSANMLDKALGVWEDARRARCKPDCRMAITYIEACSRQGMVKEAMQMYAEIKAAGPGSRLTPTVHAYTAAIRAATEGGLWERALDIWDDMVAANCKPTGHAYAAGITACAAGGTWLRAVQLFEDMCQNGVRPDVVSCTALVSALAAAGEWERAEAVVTWMLGCGLRPNVRTYTALMGALGKARQWDRAQEMLQLMQTPLWGSVQPNAYTYSALLKALGDAGEWGIAGRVFTQLEQDVQAGASRGRALPINGGGSSSSSSHRDSASTGHVGEGAASMATSSFAAMPMDQEVEEVRWAMPSGGAALGPIGKDDTEEDGAGSFDGSTAKLSTSWTRPCELHGLDLEVQNNRKNGGTKFSLFSSASDDELSPAGSPRAPPAPPPTPAAASPNGRLNGMLHKGEHDVSVIRTALSALTTDDLSRKIPLAAKLSEVTHDATMAVTPLNSKPQQHALRQEGGAGRLVNEVVCGAIMLAYEKGGQWQAAVGILDRAAALGVTPNNVMHNTAISAAGKAGELKVAEALFNKVADPDAATFGTMIAAYGLAGDAGQAEAVFAEMQDAGFTPKDYAFCGLVAAYGMQGNWKAAVEVGQRMKAAGVSPSVDVCNALIAACERCGELDQALRVHDDMRRRGVEPNAVTQQLMHLVAQQGIKVVESQQVTTAAISAALAAAGTLLMRSGIF